MSAVEPTHLKGKKIFVAGHRGMVGGALVRRLQTEGATLLTASRAELDLTSQADVQRWFETHKPDIVFLAAAKVGGILANATYPASFLYENLMIESNVIDASHKASVEKLVFLGSTCIYPKMAPQPIHEDSLLTGPLEPTNEWYAVAKIAGIKLCQAYNQQYGCNFISAQPTNLYGPGDNYDLLNSHVLPALLRKAHNAKNNGEKQLVIWGSGKPLREFLHVDDLADAVVHLAKHYAGREPVNVGSEVEITIKDLAAMVCQVVGFTGDLVFDASKPDGTPRKLTDSSRLHALGWNNARDLRTGITSTYAQALADGAV
jgi:GDP-L-fucose synthase